MEVEIYITQLSALLKLMQVFKSTNFDVLLTNAGNKSTNFNVL